MNRKSILFPSIFLAAVAGGLFSVGTLEAQNYGRAGCGLGSVIMGKGGNQSMAWTSNGILGNQTFAITSGTSNCGDSRASTHYRRQQQENFVAVNWLALEQDMAAGSGEKLDAFAALLGCPTADSSKSAESAFADHARRNHGHFFDGGSKDAPQFVSKVKDSLRRKPNLAASCNFV